MFLNCNHVMIDIETLGLEPGSVILSIGAVAFGMDRKPDMPMKEFYVELDTKQPQRVVDLDTVKWWMDQPNKPPMDGDIPLHVALKDLNEFITLQTIGDRTPYVWANGTDFDISILYHAYRQWSIPPAWKYSDVRDYRTVAKLFSGVVSRPENLNKHNALSDARIQAQHLDLILTEMLHMLRAQDDGK